MDQTGKFPVVSSQGTDTSWCFMKRTGTSSWLNQWKPEHLEKCAGHTKQTHAMIARPWKQSGETYPWQWGIRRVSNWNWIWKSITTYTLMKCSRKSNQHIQGPFPCNPGMSRQHFPNALVGLTFTIGRKHFKHDEANHIASTISAYPCMYGQHDFNKLP